MVSDMRQTGKFCNDKFWDSNLTWYSAVPDFTQCFHQTILVLTPYSLLFIIGIVKLCINLKKPVTARYAWTVLYILKMILCISLIFLSILEISFASHQKAMKMAIPDVQIYSSCVKTISYIVILFLTRQNLRKGIRSSTFLSIFWLIFSVCCLLSYRSAFIQIFEKGYMMDESYLYILDMIHFPMVLCQFLFSLFNDPASSSKEISFMADSPFFSQLLVIWFNSYIYKSTKKLLTIQDFQPLDIKLGAAYVWEKFELQWENALRKRSGAGVKPKISPFSLACILTKSVWPYFAWGCVLQLANNFSIFIPPLLLDKLIKFVTENDFHWKGHLYCIALCLSGILSQLTYTFVLFVSSLFALQVKSIIISAIYRKAIKLSTSARRKYTCGEMVNLMSVDVENVHILAHYNSLYFGSPLKILLTILMLWQYLGPSCLAGGIVFILFIIMGSFFGKATEKIQGQQMKLKDSRLKHMNEILNGIKVLKLYAWEIPFTEKISMIRQKEVNFIRKFQLLFAASIFVWNCAPIFVGIACLVTYVLVDENHVLDASTIFVSINLLNILQLAILEIPELIKKTAQTKVALERLAEFLLADEYEHSAVGDCSSPGEAVTVKNGTFAWEEEKKTEEEESQILSNIDFHVPNGSLVAITGPVGCGKSSLLSAILGEMNKIDGTVDIKGTVSYVPQQAWILNRTLKDNILFASKMDPARYNAIIKGCALKPDLKILPGGDRTEIGEKGVNLSGGQKQRVSLCRAIFHDSDIYLLDDPLSAVDSHVGKHIFEHVIGNNGLLKDKTRILVTHNINILPETDFIVTMKDGKIQETGTYKELMNSGGIFADFIAEHSNVKEVDETGEGDVFDVGDVDIATGNSINRSGPVLRSMSVESTKSNKSATLIDEENMEIGQVKRAIYINYAKHLGPLLLSGLVLGCLCSVSFDNGIKIWLSIWSGDASDPDVAHDTKMRNHRIIIYVVLGLCRTLIKIGSGVCLAFGSARAAKLYHIEMLRSVMKAPMSFFDTTPLGRIVNRFGRDIDDIDNETSFHLITYITGIFDTLSIFVIIGKSTPLFLAFLIPVGAVYFVIQIYYLVISRQLQRLFSTSRSPIFSHFTETVNGASSIRAYNIEDNFINTADEKLNTNIMCQLYYYMSFRWLELTVGLSGDIIIFIAAMLVVESKDVLEAGIAGLSLTYALSIRDTLKWMIFCGTTLETKFVSVERIEEYSNIPPEAPWVVSQNFPPSTWPKTGKVELKDYSTRYREGLDLAIKNINLDIKENEKVGIVGRTGAGKSSFALALFRLIEPVDGTVVIDDIDVSKIGLHQLRSKLTIIPQDPVLFTGSLRMNLDPDNKHSDDELWNSLESSHLKVFVSSLTEGLDYEIAEGGENLSVGQRQLVCLARALLKEAKILILDEATAAVDMDTDSLIQNTIRSDFKNYTVITIAHRLNTIMDYDKIVVMEFGEIAEVGSPSELLQRPNSHFSKMAKAAGLIN